MNVKIRTSCEKIYKREKKKNKIFLLVIFITNELNYF